MSGAVVPFLGGPLDGREAHRALSTGGVEERLYCADRDFNKGAGVLVDVYRAGRAVRAPFVYQGTRLSAHGETVWPTTL